MGRSWFGRYIFLVRTITSTFTCCGAGTVATSTGQTAPTYFSVSARIARVVLRGSLSSSLWIHSAATSSPRAAEKSGTMGARTRCSFSDF